MTPTQWTDEHQSLIESAAPRASAPDSADVERVWNRISMELVGEPRPRGRRRMAIGAGIAAIVLGTSGVAVAEYYSARTGQGPTDAEDLLLGGPGERLDPAAADFAQVVAEETRDIPFPSEDARRIAIDAQVADNTPSPEDAHLSHRLSVGALRAWVADAAICSWTDQWASATARGDSAVRDEAAAVLRGAPSWPAVRDIDPNPVARIDEVHYTDESGRTTKATVRDDSQFNYLKALNAAVQDGNTTAAAAVLADNNGYCIDALVPNIPDANPMHGVR